MAGSFSESGTGWPESVLPDGYELLSELGRGTTGYVFKARHHVLKRVVALKLPLLASEAEGSLQLRRFHLEAQVLAYLTGGPDSGPTIPRLYEVGESQGQPYYVREYVEGHTLVQRVADRSLGLRECLGVLAAVARTVARVHDQEFVHQNLRPSNVLVPPGGMPKLIGFGRASRPARPTLVRAGTDGAPADVDVQALIEMVTWLCAGLEQPIPTRLALVCERGPAVGAAALAESLAACVDERQADR